MTNIDLNNKTILITGVAGFIGSYLCKKLLESIDSVKIIGLDSITDYYDVSLKEERLSMLKKLNKDFTFISKSCCSSWSSLFNHKSRSLHSV